MRFDVGAAVPNAPAPNLAAINEERQKGPLPQAILDVGSLLIAAAHLHARICCFQAGVKEQTTVSWC